MDSFPIPARRHKLLQKYDVPSPRYTSYPTVPYWDSTGFSTETWEEHVKNAFRLHNPKDGLSLYLHLPFCEKLCTYCGCNKRITRNHGVESPYIAALLQEWGMYRAIFGGTPRISELHLGGGTPTFFSAENLKRLVEGLLQHAEVTENAAFSLEVHPNYTDAAQLQVLYELGFRRLSVGVQDFDPRVQLAINRIQTFEQTKKTFEEARAIGFTSMNADIIYGLPLQTAASIALTVAHVKELRPERIAFYSYAHVPWTSKGQRHYQESDLPSAEEKRSLYEFGKELLLEAGYREIGMDHFALPQDELFHATRNGTLHRNFMGYTTTASNMLIGLGASSISDTWTAFGQNLKDVREYEQAVASGKLPICKGHLLTEEDLVLRRHILNLMCRLETSWEQDGQFQPWLHEAVQKLEEPITDELVKCHENGVQILPEGQAFMRNICMCFDARLWRNQPRTPVFSRSV